MIRVDPAPGFQALKEDVLLRRNHITIEIGRVKNVNKNPVAEKAVQELETEILRQEPRGEHLSPCTLAIATARLNTRIRSRGLSAREMWYQRDQFNNAQIPIQDTDLIASQHTLRKANHEYSEKAKAPLGAMPHRPDIKVGDLIYLKEDY